jgi:hypothetical protein
MDGLTNTQDIEGSDLDEPLPPSQPPTKMRKKGGK